MYSGNKVETEHKIVSLSSMKSETGIHTIIYINIKHAEGQLISWLDGLLPSYQIQIRTGTELNHCFCISWFGYAEAVIIYNC